MKHAMRVVILAVWFLFGEAAVFPQDELAQRGSIPQELLRPRREEAPRFPVDTVIGPLGRGQAPEGAYEIARRTATALLAGDMNASVLSSVNKVFLESCMAMLDEVNPRFFRMGSGREEPDGSCSFLVRFVGREQGITGELYVRFEERRRAAAAVETPAAEDEAESEALLAEAEGEEDAAMPGEAVAAAENESETDAEALAEAPPETAVPVPQAAAATAAIAAAPAAKVWLFEDLILEEARSREVENGESRHRFDFPPYERFF